MGTDWDSFVEQARQSLKEDGMEISVAIKTPGAYNAVTGKTEDADPDIYTTHGVVTNYEVETDALISPKDVQIITHAGLKSNPLPDLLNKKNLELIAAGKTYEVINVKAISPAGVVIIYKFQAREIDSG